jgi:hypothetical protein
VQDIHPLLRARIVSVGGRGRFEPMSRRAFNGSTTMPIALSSR